MTTIIDEGTDIEITIDIESMLMKKAFVETELSGALVLVHYSNAVNGQRTYTQDLDYTDVTNPIVGSASALKTAIDDMIGGSGGGGGGVSSVTAGGSIVTVDNTDPANPVVNFQGETILNETPGGAVNGVNTAFTTANNYQSGKLMVFRNGQQDIEITAGGGSAFTITNPPTGDEIIRVIYLKA